MSPSSRSVRTGGQAVPPRAASASASAALTTAPGKASVGTRSGTFGTGYLLRWNVGAGPPALPMWPPV